MSGNRKQSYLQHKNYNMSLIQELFNIVAPHECLVCRKEGSLLCYECGLSLITVPPRCYVCGRWNDGYATCRPCRKRSSIHSLYTAAKYEGTAKDLLHLIKFERAQAGAKPVAELLAARAVAGDDLVVTCIPTASSRVRSRGYDQAELIAKELARRLGRPFSPCLVRLGQQRQLGTSRQARKQQMQEAFRPAKIPAFQGKHVLLVDDVLTTGATCEAAARILRQAGAKRVSAAVFAVA